MSTMSDYYCPGEEPAHDCDPPDYDEAFPPEERMLEACEILRANVTAPHAHRALTSLEEYIKQAIADRDAPTPWECDHDTEAGFTDPFADTDD
jgi:hypothetical protein